MLPNQFCNWQDGHVTTNVGPCIAFLDLCASAKEQGHRANSACKTEAAMRINQKARILTAFQNHFFVDLLMNSISSAIHAETMPKVSSLFCISID